MATDSGEVTGYALIDIGRLYEANRMFNRGVRKISYEKLLNILKKASSSEHLKVVGWASVDFRNESQLKFLNHLRDLNIEIIEEEVRSAARREARVKQPSQMEEQLQREFPPTSIDPESLFCFSEDMAFFIGHLIGKEVNPGDLLVVSDAYPLHRTLQLAKAAGFRVKLVWFQAQLPRRWDYQIPREDVVDLFEFTSQLFVNSSNKV